MFEETISSINLKLLPIKIHFFLYHTGTGPISACIAIIARQKGFSATIVGIILTCLFISATIVRQFFGWLGDKVMIHKVIFIIMQLVTAIVYFSIYFVPSFSDQVILKTTINETKLYFCPENPIWDQCLDFKLQSYRKNFSKCYLNCETQTSNLHEISYRVEKYFLVDLRTVERNSSCLTMNSFKGSYQSHLISEFNCLSKCDDDFLKATLVNKGSMKDEEIIKRVEFWIFVILLLVGNSAYAIVNNMADTICFELLGDDGHLYGRQRMWDAIGSGLSWPLIGLMIDSISVNQFFKDYRPIFFFCLVTVLINACFSLKLKSSGSTKSEHIFTDIWNVCKSFKVFTFFGWCFFVGLFSASIWNFLYWHLEDLTDAIEQKTCDENYLKTLQGIVAFVQSILGEIPFFFWSGYIIQKIGHTNCKHLILAAFAIRFFYYSALINPWLVLPIEILNGVNYGLLYPTMTSYANSISPPGTEATMQAIVGTIFEGLGVSLGNLITGNLFKLFGGRMSFMILGIIALISLISHLIIHTALNFKEKRATS